MLRLFKSFSCLLTERRKAATQRRGFLDAKWAIQLRRRNADVGKIAQKQRGEFQQRLTEAGSDRRETKQKWEVWQEGKHSSQGTKCNRTASLESYSKHQTCVGWQGLGIIWTISWYDANSRISSSAILLFWYQVFLNHFAIIAIIVAKKLLFSSFAADSNQDLPQIEFWFAATSLAQMYIINAYYYISSNLMQWSHTLAFFGMMLIFTLT